MLAVDLPEMTTEFLRELSTHCKKNAGAVPCLGGEIEPLAAFYPKAAHSLAAILLQKNSNAVKNFAGRCVQGELAARVDFQKSDGRFFRNCNTPDEFFIAGR